MCVSKYYDFIQLLVNILSFAEMRKVVGDMTNGSLDPKQTDKVFHRLKNWWKQEKFSDAGSVASQIMISHPHQPKMVCHN